MIAAISGVYAVLVTAMFVIFRMTPQSRQPEWQTGAAVFFVLLTVLFAVALAVSVRQKQQDY